MDRSANNAQLGGRVVFADLQGNIVRGYGQIRSVLCFLRFGSDAKGARAWISDHVLGESSRFRITTEESPGLPAEKPFVNFLLTHGGLKKLECPESRLAGMDPAFRRGSRAQETRSILNDAPLSDWSPEYQDEWDALLIVACTASQASEVRSALLELTDSLPARHLEIGNALDSRGAPLTDAESDEHLFEPFGYRDGISQLYFDDAGANRDRAKSRAGWNSQRELSIVLSADPLSPTSGYGSYFVYRKLEQDVQGFRDKVQRAAEALLTTFEGSTRSKGRFLYELYGSNPQGAFGLFAADDPPSTNEVEEFVKGRLMGRFPSGRPLVAANQPAPSAFTEDDDSFDYSGDRSGHQCPFYAHIRKMNARGSRGDSEEQKRRDICRRGIPYGRADGPSQEPCGLLFLCAQNNIAEQFEFHQANWGNGKPVNFEAEPAPGHDNVMAQPFQVDDVLDYGDGLDRYQRYADTMDVDVRIYDYVKLRGSEYLFAPSVSGLRALAKGELR